MRNLFQKFFDVFAIFLKFSPSPASFSRFLGLLGPVWMHSDPFGCIRMYSDAFGCVRTLSEISEILLEKYVFRNFCEVSEKLEAWDRLRERYWLAPRPACTGERRAASILAFFLGGVTPISLLRLNGKEAMLCFNNFCLANV